MPPSRQLSLLGASLVALVFGTTSVAPPSAFSDSKKSLFSATLSDGELAETLRSGKPVWFNVVGHSSVSLQMGLQGSTVAAYKLASRTFPRAPQAEVAAYKLSVLLGLDNVPPSVLRRIPGKTIDKLVRSGSRAEWLDLEGEVRWLDGRLADGVASAWVVGLGSLDLEHRHDWWRSWHKRGATVPKQRLALARDLSNMVVFDFLIGNPDRFSGRNMKVLLRVGRFMMLDHDQGFPSIESRESHSLFLLKSLQLTQRFSAGLVRHLRALDERSLRSTLVVDAKPLLTKGQIRGVLKRRKALLTHISSLQAEYGKDAVLYFR